MAANTKGFDATLKILIIGDSGVGKTSIMLRFTDNSFDSESACTIGVDFKSCPFTTQDGRSVNLTLWDTAGQEKFRSLTSSWYRAAHGVIIVYDISHRDTFLHIDSWLEEVELFSTKPNLVKLLVGNKIDKFADRQVSREEGSEAARRREMLFIEASAKTSEGVSQTFEELVQKIVDTMIPEKKPTQSILTKPASPPSNTCC